MQAASIILDWNRTLIEFPDEGDIWSYIAVRVLKDAIFNGRIRKAWNIFGSVLKLKLWKMRFDAGNLKYSALYDLYNSKILEGADARKISELTSRYAQTPKIKNAIDEVLLNTIKRHSGRFKIGILSCGYRTGIQEILKEAGYGDIFSFIEANRLEEDKGMVARFNYSEVFHNKKEKLLQLMKNEGIDKNRTVYIGDTADDDGCFEIVGYPVLSSLAPGDYRKEFREKYPDGLVLEPMKYSPGTNYYKELDNLLHKIGN